MGKEEFSQQTSISLPLARTLSHGHPIAARKEEKRTQLSLGIRSRREGGLAPQPHGFQNP